MLAAGLTLRHYRSFEACPVARRAEERVAGESPELDRYGIHVLVSQNGRGEVVIGDSHEYGDAIEPFDKAEIDDLILDYLGTFLDVRAFRIVGRAGTGSMPSTRPSRIAWPTRPAPGTVITGVGGAGMTLSFGLAGSVVRISRSPRGRLTAMAIELVVFDMAGTTVDDGGAVNRCFREALAGRRPAAEPEAVNGVMGLPKPEAFRILSASDPAARGPGPPGRRDPRRLRRPDARLLRRSTRGRRGPRRSRLFADLRRPA